MPRTKNTKAIEAPTVLDTSDYLEVKQFNPDVKSLGHQFRDYTSQPIMTPYKRYYKNVLHMVSATRLNPNKQSQKKWIDVLLKSSVQDTTYVQTYANGKTRVLPLMELPWRYDEEVIETYTEEDDKAFRARNLKSFQNGTLLEYNGEDFVFRYKIEADEEGNERHTYEPLQKPETLP